VVKMVRESTFAKRKVDFAERSLIEGASLEGRSYCQREEIDICIRIGTLPSTLIPEFEPERVLQPRLSVPLQIRGKQVVEPRPAGRGRDGAVPAGGLYPDAQWSTLLAAIGSDKEFVEFRHIGGPMLGGKGVQLEVGDL